MPHRIIGIDVGSYSVKVAVIERSFKSFAFVEFHERRIQPNELLTPEESLAIAIQGLIDDHNLRWDVACTGFSAQRVTSRLLTFPFGSEKKIDQTIQYEIEGYIPFSAEDIVSDYVVVWHTKDASRVMVVYVQRKELARELKMLSAVGVDPRFICVEGAELPNLIGMGMVPPEGAYAVVDVGHAKSTVAICRGRRIGYLRAISVAGKAITDAIAARLAIPGDEAERLKIEMGALGQHEEGAADDLTREVAAAIRGVGDELLLHLRQTLFAYRESEGVPVEGIYLCGGTSRLPGLDRFISEALKLNVTHLNCADFHFTRLDHTDAHRHVIPQALAFALRAAAGGGPDVNLRRGEFSFKGDVEEFGGNIRRVGVILGLVVFLALGSFTAKYYSVKRQIDRIRADVAALAHQAIPDAPERAVNSPKAAIAYIKSKEGEVSERMAQLEAAVGTSPLDALKEISAALPPRGDLKLDVTEINIAGDRVTMSGIVDDIKAHTALKQALEKQGSPFTKVAGDTGKGVKGEVKFKLSMEIAREGAREAPKEAARPKE